MAKRSRHSGAQAFSRLRKVIFLLLLVIGLFPALTILGLVYSKSRQEMFASTGEYFSEISTFAAQEIEISLRDNISLTFWVASIPQIRDELSPLRSLEKRDLESMAQFVIDEFSRRGAFITIFTTGEEVLFSNGANDHPHPLAHLPSDFSRRGQAFVDIVPREDVTVRFRVDIFVPILDMDDNFIGVARSSTNIDRLFDRVRGLRLGETGHHDLVNSVGALLFCSLNRSAVHKVDHALLDQIGMKKNGWIRAKETIYWSPDTIIGYASVDVTDLRIHPDSYGDKRMSVFTTQDPGETAKPFRDYRVVIAGYGMMLTVLTLLLGLMAFRMILSAQKKYEGDLVSRVKSESMRQLLHTYHRLSIESISEVESLLIESEKQGMNPRNAKRICKIRKGLATVGSALDHLSFFTGATDLTPTSFDLGNMIEETLLMLDHLFSRSKITTLFRTGEKKIVINGDVKLLRLLLLNIFMNAVQAIRAGEGEILVALSSDGMGHATITVTDNGEGIPSDRIDGIFDPFNSTKKGASHRGIGLATSSGIVNAHQGEICVESALGAGCVVTIILPIIAEGSEEESFPATPPTLDNEIPPVP